MSDGTNEDDKNQGVGVPFSVRLTEKEALQLSSYARKTFRSKTDVVRMALNWFWDAEANATKGGEQ